MLESVRQRQRETCKEEIRAIVSYQHEHAANQQLQTFHVEAPSSPSVIVHFAGIRRKLRVELIDDGSCSSSTTLDAHIAFFR